MTEFGIDISNNQNAFDFVAAAAEGITFATHKICEGTWRDLFWLHVRAEMATHFQFWGGYSHCRLDTAPEVEADAALSYIGDTDIPIQIDYEDLKGTPSIRDLLARIDALTERGFELLPVYLPRWYCRDYMGAHPTPTDCRCRSGTPPMSTAPAPPPSFTPETTTPGGNRWAAKTSAFSSSPPPPPSAANSSTSTPSAVVETSSSTCSERNPICSSPT